MTEIQIWGIKINPITKQQLIESIDENITKSGKLLHLTGVNPETIAKASIDQELRKAINDSDIVNIDNMMVVTSLRILGYKIPERVACPDVFQNLLILADKKGYSVYFLGAKQEILDRMTHNIRMKYHNLNILGTRNGYYKKEEEEEIVSVIRKLKPDMVFLGLPTPQKENFILKHKSALGAKFAFGVGGAFDVQAGKVVRAPLWMQKIGLEGFHRIAQNPLDYGARAMKYYIPFARLFFKELFNKHK